jgi:hypothetical protein
MFNLDTVPEVNIKESTYGSINVIYNKERFTYLLYNDGIQWMGFDRHSNKEIKEMYSSYDLAYGNVLISGLGFGILALWLASKPEVKSITVAEVSEDVVGLFLKNNTLPDKIKIIVQDISKYTTKEKYDCIFLDHYEDQPYMWRLENMKKIVKAIPNHTIFWAWALEAMYCFYSYGLSKELLEGPFLYYNNVDFSTNWEKFKSETLNISTCPNLSPKKINEYVYTYYDRIGYTPLYKE